MTGFWRKGSDTLHNGTVLGALLGAAIVWGNHLYSWLITNIPGAWLKLGSYSLPIYLVGAGALIGYLIDRN